MARLQQLLHAPRRIPAWLAAALVGLGAGFALGYFAPALLGPADPAGTTPAREGSSPALASRAIEQPLAVGTRLPLLPGKWINGTAPRMGAGYRLLVIDVWADW
jgi:hypothetical protein